MSDTTRPARAGTSGGISIAGWAAALAFSIFDAPDWIGWVCLVIAVVAGGYALYQLRWIRRHFPLRWVGFSGVDQAEEIAKREEHAAAKRLREHNIATLTREYGALRNAWNKLRVDEVDAAAAESFFKLRTEPILYHELGGAGGPRQWQIDHFYDDTGFQQGILQGPPEKTDVANFLERRLERLLQIIAQLKQGA